MKHSNFTVVSCVLLTNSLLLWNHSVLFVEGFFVTTKQAMNNNNMKLYGKDDDDFFDPLLSPHAYPNGTSNKKKKQPTNDNDNDDWSPMKMKNVKNDFVGASDYDYVTKASSFTSNWSNSNNNNDDDDNNNSDDDNSLNKKQEDVLDYFDPRISPHSYPNGIPSPDGRKRKKNMIGVVLIDHGSRRQSSNDQLLHLASTVQNNYFADDNAVIVKGAHMEIAKPSIMDVVQDLVTNHNIKTIVCHPYFLSPGRHVTEDIPQLIQEAQEWAGDSVDIQITEPIGANPQIMAQLIHQVLTPTLKENGYSSPTSDHKNNMLKDDQPLGGIFGEIKRMLEEEDA